MKVSWIVMSRNVPGKSALRDNPNKSFDLRSLIFQGLTKMKVRGSWQSMWVTKAPFMPTVKHVFNGMTQTTWNSNKSQLSPF